MQGSLREASQSGDQSRVALLLQAKASPDNTDTVGVVRSTSYGQWITLSCVECCDSGSTTRTCDNCSYPARGENKCASQDSSLRGQNCDIYSMSIISVLSRLHC